MGCTGYGREYSPLRLEETRARLSDENAQTTARTKNVGFWQESDGAVLLESDGMYADERFLMLRVLTQ